MIEQMVPSSLFSDLVFRYTSKWRNLRHHLRHAPWPKLYAYEKQRTGKTYLPWIGLLNSAWQHGACFEDYYRLHFFEKNRNQRRECITRSIFYEFTRQVNPLEKTPVLRDKALFIKHFQDCLGRDVWTWDELLNQNPEDKPPARVVIKNRWGAMAQDMHFPEESFKNWAEVCQYIENLGKNPQKYLCETYLKQHPTLEKLNPGSVNTLRVITFRQDSGVEIWGTILRIGIGNGPDNLAQGGLAAFVGNDGRITQKALFKDPFKPQQAFHPMTQEALIGLQIPYYEQAKKLAIESAKRVPDLRCVGWDIALKPDGPCLIEGNDRFSHVLWGNYQNSAIRHRLDPHCNVSLVYT